MQVLPQSSPGRMTIDLGSVVFGFVENIDAVLVSEEHLVTHSYTLLRIEKADRPHHQSADLRAASRSKGAAQARGLAVDRRYCRRKP